MIKLGVTLPQFTTDARRFLSAAERAIEAGLDSLWLFDHIWPLSGGRERPVLECWSALAYLAAHTRDVSIGTLVTRSTLRHPAVLAKMAATVAGVAPGRLIVAIGSGDAGNRQENEAFGLPYFAGQKRLRQYAATVDLVRRFMRESAVTLCEPPVDVTDLATSPRPDLPAPVWMAGRSLEVLELAGRTADGWNAWAATPEEFELEAGHVRAAAGDRPVELSWAGMGELADDDAQARRRAGERGLNAGAIVGGPEAFADRLGAYARLGASHLIVTFARAGDAGPYELLGGEVKPRLAGLTVIPPGGIVAP